jgi:uncharacterized membrane protein (UPF0182 family)
VLPVEGSLIYVQPIYLRAQGGRIPELKRVVAVHEGRVSMGESLDDALSALYEQGSTSAPPALRLPETAATGETSALVRQAREHYDRARAAQRADDWATYGEEMRRLGDVLRELDRQPKP